MIASPTVVAVTRAVAKARMQAPDAVAIPSPVTSSVSVAVHRLQCFKTKPCRFWQEGRCSRGSRCTYAHAERELRVPPDLSKTKICTRWKRGVCADSSVNCCYAHGISDLRCPPSSTTPFLESRPDLTQSVAHLQFLPDNGHRGVSSAAALSLRLGALHERDNKVMVSHLTQLTSRSTATVESTVSTACSTHWGLETSGDFRAHDESGSSESSCYGGEREPASSQECPFSCIGQHSCLPAPVDLEAGPIPNTRRSSTGTLQQAEDSEAQLALCATTATEGTVNTAGGLLSSLRSDPNFCRQPPEISSASNHPALLVPGFLFAAVMHHFEPDGTDLEKSDDEKDGVQQALLNSLLIAYRD